MTSAWIKKLGCVSLLLLAACGGDDDASSSDAGSGDEVPQEPAAKFLPVVTGKCPGFEEGDGCTKDDVSLICTFQPAEVEKPRSVRVWFDESVDVGKAGHPLVIFWHGLGSQAAHAVGAGVGLGPDISQEIIDSGTILVAPEKEDGRAVGLASLPWLAALGAGPDDDFLVMDEVVACADEMFGIDTRRIHSTGLSAGAIQTGQVLAKRSGYLASAVMFSGSVAGAPKPQDPKNTLPVAVVYGGPTDIVEPLKFTAEAMKAREWLADHDYFSILCNHDNGHNVPDTAAALGWRFMQDHPFGARPYAKGLPKDFPADYCEL
jgi:dienelactone hydrolase